MKEPRMRTWPTFAVPLLYARAALRLPDEIGLAIRADRRRLGLSQRAYATKRSLSAAAVARLEARAGALKLSVVISALEGTPFVLCLCHRPDVPEPAAAALAPSAPPTPQPPPTPVPNTFWPREELIARVRSASRRFPAHHPTYQVVYPPLWWWNNESTWVFSKRPNWYAPRVGPPIDDAS